MIGVAVRGQNGDLVAQTLEAYGGMDGRRRRFCLAVEACRMPLIDVNFRLLMAAVVARTGVSNRASPRPVAGVAERLAFRMCEGGGIKSTISVRSIATYIRTRRHSTLNNPK
jgi:hypothetical protein